MDEVVGDLVLYCGLLSCRKPIVQEIGPGRRKEFCSETCRRAADRDYKRAETRLRTFQDQLRTTQHEVAAYGRKADQGMLTDDDVQSLRFAARVALSRAVAVLEFSSDGDAGRFRDELRTLVEALRPLLESEQVRVSA